MTTDLKKLRDADRALAAANERADAARRALIQTIDELRTSGVTWIEIANHLSITAGSSATSAAASAKMWFRRNTRPGDLPEPATADDGEKELPPPTTEGMSAAEMASELGLGEGAFRYQFAKKDSPLHDRIEPISSSYNGVKATRYKFKS